MQQTGTNQFLLNWLNIDPNNLKITVEYIVNFILDDGEKLDRKPEKVVISGDMFLKIFNFKLSDLPTDVIENFTLGELISGLVSFGVKKLSNALFPQTPKETQYLTSVADTIFNDEPQS